MRNRTEYFKEYAKRNRKELNAYMREYRKKKKEEIELAKARIIELESLLEQKEEN